MLNIGFCVNQLVRYHIVSVQADHQRAQNVRMATSWKITSAHVSF